MKRTISFTWSNPGSEIEYQITGVIHPDRAGKIKIMKTSVSFIHPVFKMVVAHGEFVQQQGGGKSLVIRAILNPRNKDIQNSFSAQELEKVEALLKENYHETNAI